MGSTLRRHDKPPRFQKNTTSKAAGSVAPTDADLKSAARTETSAAPEEQTVLLSPFEVVAETNGYCSANTTPGTHFDTKLEDPASSSTVVTKEQMQDFARLDIDGIFLHSQHRAHGHVHRLRDGSQRPADGQRADEPDAGGSGARHLARAYLVRQF